MSEDLIKRSDAIRAFVEETNGVNVEKAIKVVDAYLRIRECDEVWDSIRAIRDCLECAKDDIVERIPSADRPQGYWTKTDVATYRCSECGKIQIADDDSELNFCCCCGSRNKVRRLKGADDEV